MTLRDNANNALYTVANDVSGVIYYKSYSLTINVEGQNPAVMDIKHTSTLVLSGFCPAKEEVKELLGADSAQYSFTNDLPTELPLEDGKTYTEKREERKYTVKIGYDNPFEAAYGSKLKKPEDPVKTKEGYTCIFQGWFNGETEWDFENNTVTSNVTLVAEFSEAINKYTVTITFVGIEKDPVTLSVEHNGTVDLTAYNKAGYDLVIKKGNDEITELTVTENVELTITYTKQAPEESSSESTEESVVDSESGTESIVKSGNSGNESTGGCFGSVKNTISVTALLGLAVLAILKKKNK